MFERLPDTTGVSIDITIDGARCVARDGDTVAAALLANGVDAFRTTPVTGASRGPWCLMGVCFDCLVEIDGRANCRACMTRVAKDMRIVTRRSAGSESA